MSEFIPQSSKVDVIKAIYKPIKLRDIQHYLVLVNDYREMWRNRAHTIASQTKLCYTKVKFIWHDIEEKFFMKMKKIVGIDVLLSYLNFSEEFIIHTNARKFKL